MATVFLRATCTPNGPSAFTRTEFLWDKDTRTETSQASNVLACQVYELAVGATIDSWCDLNGTKTTVLYRAGDGYAPGTNLTGRSAQANHPACPVPGSLSTGFVTSTPASGPSTPDGRLLVPYTTPFPPVVGVLNGQQLFATGGTGELEFTGLLPGTYALDLEDANSQQLQRGGLVVGPTGGEAPPPTSSSNTLWLRYQVDDIEDPAPQDPEFPGILRLLGGSYWDPASKSVKIITIQVESNYEPAFYARPLTQRVDGYTLSGGVVFRQVYHADTDGDGVGDGNVRFVDSVPAGTPPTTGLTIDNIILAHIHRPTPESGAPAGPAVGSALLEASSTASGPLTYTRLSTGEANATGAFSGLPAGSHLFRVQDAGGNSVEFPVVIEDRYRPRWFVQSFSNAGRSVRVDIFGRDYAGPATEVRAAGDEALERTWGAAGADLEGSIPEASGQSCRLTVRQQAAGQFADVFLSDDRAFRLDVHVAGVLVFRGYIAPDLYDEDLSKLSGGDITFTAGDGLGSLRDTAFLNHDARPLSGRWPLLHTLLHCVSRCGAGPLPLYVQTDLREASQPADTDWLPTFTTDRTGYAEGEGKEWSCRQVIEALLRPAHAVLVQRAGAWWVLSANAAGTPAAFYAYAPNGTALAAPAPAVPQLRPAGWMNEDLHWVDAAQRAQTLAPARGVVARTKLQLVANQLRDGLLQTWQPDLLRPLGWTGTLNVERFDTTALEDAKALAGVTKLRTSAGQPAGAALLSPALPFRPFADESPVRVALRLRVRPAPDGTDLTATITVRPRLSGIAYPTALTWQVGSQEKEVTVEGFIPFGEGTAEGQLRVELLPPTIPGPFTTPVYTPVDLYEVTLQILPGAVEWPDADEVTALSETGFLVLPAVDLHHADTPRLPLSDGTLRPVPTMDAAAWRHALTYRDGTPTTAWRRSTGSLLAAPLLETAALDRLDVRRAPVSVFLGPVHGTGVHALGYGAVVDVPEDAPGVRFWCVGASVRDLDGEAQVSLREVGAVAVAAQPENRLIAHTGAALVSETGAVLVYA